MKSVSTSSAGTSSSFSASGMSSPFGRPQYPPSMASVSACEMPARTRTMADFSTPNVSIVHGSVVRYSELEGGDDKLTCAGTVDAYVRGVMQ